MKHEWIDFNNLLFGAIFFNRMTLECEEFHISYNGRPEISVDHVEETALCKDGSYYILNGDFRKEYDDLFDQGFEACKAFYDSKKAEFNSIWTFEKE